MNLTEELRTKDALVAVGKSIDEDRKLGTFGQPGTESVAWVMKDPQGAQEVMTNAYERLRSLGVSNRAAVERHDFEDVGIDIARDLPHLTSAEEICAEAANRFGEIGMHAYKPEVSISEHMKVLEVRMRLNAKNASM